ncbi:MAG: cardiolipin synthase [Gammaproteobacteria bacterium]|nr:cardiolipin synthase [Gammaproteobacteria bacterium]
MSALLTWSAAFIIAAIILYATFYFLGRRRATPPWQFDSKAMPEMSEIIPSLAGMTEGHWYEGNKVEVLTNGELFQPFLRDIDEAQKTVHLETFVWWAGDLEKRVADALIAAAGRGVEVRLMVDGVGSMKRTDGIFRKLRDGGVQLHVFSPLTLLKIHRFNERTHRKLLIVDGKVGYTMGHGIADEWLGNAQGQGSFRDTGVRLTGPIVHGLQTVFVTGWISETCEVLCGDAVFPSLKTAGDVPMSIVASAAGDQYSSVELAYSFCIAAAKREILIQNPYFAPDRNVVSLLCDAARRGVSVRLMLPGSSNDSNLIRRAAQYLYPQLLDAGVDVLEFTPTLLHQKVMVVDGELARIGSTNFDCRSLELNQEAGVAILNSEIAEQLRSQFFTDAQRCRRISKSEVDNYSLTTRALGAATYMIHAQL